ncbi:MAG: hypothetical protein EBX40_03005 [Gammaproteobacteria bacterium]|nr:hypothetical protein [Gammaproteobacteria bacterium]
MYLKKKHLAVLLNNERRDRDGFARFASLTLRALSAPRPTSKMPRILSNRIFYGFEPYSLSLHVFKKKKHLAVLFF